MRNENIKNLINQRFNLEEIFDQIPSNKRGVLCYFIKKIANSLKDDEIKAKDICEFFGIIESSYLEDDFGIAYDNIGKNYLDIVKKSLRIDKIDIFGVLPILEKPTFTTFCLKLEEKEQMEVIVVTAFLLISVFGLVWKSSTQNQRQNILPKERPAIVPNQPILTAICLAVPASEVCGLTKGELINRNKIIQLIDAASDFSCLKKEEAENLSIDIDKNQNPSPDSQLKFYIRIDIPDGREIFDKQTKYVIKRDLPLNTEGTIIDIGRLKSISSISSFHRI